MDAHPYDIAGAAFRAYAAFRVRAAAEADALRALLLRFAALFFACLEIACELAADLGSRFSAAETARERFPEILRFGFAAAAESCLAFFRKEGDPLGGLNFTPARRAFERPMATACCVDLAPCLPSRM